MSVVVTNTTASLSGKTLAKLEDAQTITGSKLFDLGASPPFGVVSGAAKVDNLDADKLDGQEGTAYHDAALLTGVLPVTVVGADPNADRVVFWDDSANAYAFLQLLGTTIRTTNLTLAKAIPNGRLTLTSGTPVTTTDVTAASTLFWALYGGNQIALYNGTAWENFIVAELSIGVPNVAGQINDVFVDYNGGTPALSLTAWSSDTARATALTLQDGVLVLTGSTGKRYVGSVRTINGAGTTEDSVTKRYVWNYYNRQRRVLRKQEATATWNYTTATIRQANASAANQVEVLIGVAEIPLTLALTATADNGTNMGMGVGIGEDSTTVISPSQIGGGGTTGATGLVDTVPLSAFLHLFPAIGRHVYAWLEYSQAAGTTTWHGTPSATNAPTGTANGLSGWIEG